jgi:hypothetical protein
MWSIEDLYRLQQFLETREPSTIDRRTIVTDKRLLEELAHYLKFASAAYGWKGSIFTHKFGSDYGALSIDDAAQLAKAAGIDRRDIVTANGAQRDIGRPTSLLETSSGSRLCWPFVGPSPLMIS